MIEIERKFLVRGDFKSLATSHSHIAQGYLCADGTRTVRVRLRDKQAYLTIKGASYDGGLSRFEFEKEIAYGEGLALMRLCQPGIVEKVRYLVPYEGHTFEVDEFLGDNAGLVVAEVELSAADETAVLPAFIGQEVTADRRYRNAYLRACPYKDWQ